MTKEDLMKFCSDTDTDRFNLSVPWSIGDFTYASNGHIIVRVPRLADIESNAGPKVDDLFHADPPAWFHLSGLSLPEIEIKECSTCGGKGKDCECPECNGAGEIEFDNMRSRYTVECLTCGGFGNIKDDCLDCSGKGTIEIEKPYPFKIGTSHFQVIYLRWLAELPNCSIGPSPDPLKPAPFRFDGGDGLLMPMRV
jgi:hypothetical protein